MIKDEQGRILHDRATRGETLSEQEKQQLEGWYTQQDKLELEAIQMAIQENPLSALQAQIEAALTQLVKLASKIQQMASENEKLRNENAELLNQLAQRLGQQPA